MWVILGVSAAAQAQEPLASVFDPNPVVSNGTLSQVTLADLQGDKSRLTGKSSRVLSCQTNSQPCAAVQHAAADEAGNFFYVPEEGSNMDAFAEVNAYFHIWRAANYFQANHGITWTCACGAENLRVILDSASDPSEDPTLAVYVPNRCETFECGSIVLGVGRNAEGELRNFAYDGDVLYHEYAHAVIDERNGNAGVRIDEQGVSYEPSSVREGGADYFAAAIGGDPHIAEHLAGIGFLPESEALRSIDKPLRCPTDLTGNGHKDGRIFGGALWEARAILTPSIADDIVVHVLLEAGNQPTMSETIERLLTELQSQRANDNITAEQFDAVEEIFDAHGLIGCARIAPLSQSEHVGYSGVPLSTLQGKGVAPLHFSLSIPDNASEVEITLRTLTGVPGHLLYLRNGMPVEVHSDDEAPISDITLEVIASKANLRDTANYTLPRGGSLYVAVASTNLGEGSNWFAISAHIVSGGVAGGGGCAITESREGVWWIFLIVGLALRGKTFLYSRFK